MHVASLVFVFTRIRMHNVLLYSLHSVSSGFAATATALFRSHTAITQSTYHIRVSYSFTQTHTHTQRQTHTVAHWIIYVSMIEAHPFAVAFAACYFSISVCLVSIWPLPQHNVCPYTAQANTQTVCFDVLSVLRTKQQHHTEKGRESEWIGEWEWNDSGARVYFIFLKITNTHYKIHNNSRSRSSSNSTSRAKKHTNLNQRWLWHFALLLCKT